RSGNLDGGTYPGGGGGFKARQMAAPEPVVAPPSVPGGEPRAVAEPRPVEGRAVGTHHEVGVGDAAVPVARAPAPAPVNPEIERAAVRVVGVEAAPPGPAARAVAVVAQVARIADLVVDVVGRVAGGESVRIVRLGHQPAADALHGHERIAHDPAFGRDALFVV